MKKIPQEIDPHLFFKFVSLYRDDLDEIVTVLSAAGPVLINSGGYRFDDLDELKKYFGNNSPDIEIELMKKATPNLPESSLLQLTFHENGPVGLFCYKNQESWFYRVKEILSENSNKTQFSAQTVAYLVPPFILSFLLGFSTTAPALSMADWFGVAIVAMGALIMTLSLTMKKSKKLWFIDLNYRHRPKFFERNKDKILWAFIGGAIALLYTYLASLFD